MPSRRKKGTKLCVVSLFLLRFRRGVFLTVRVFHAICKHLGAESFHFAHWVTTNWKIDDDCPIFQTFPRHSHDIPIIPRECASLGIIADWNNIPKTPPTPDFRIKHDDRGTQSGHRIRYQTESRPYPDILKIHIN